MTRGLRPGCIPVDRFTYRCGSLLTFSQVWVPLDTQKVRSIEYLEVTRTDRIRSFHQLGSAGTQGMRILVRTTTLITSNGAKRPEETRR